MDVKHQLPPAARSDVRLGVWLALVVVFAASNFVGNAETDPPKDFVYLWSSAIANAIFVTLELGIALVLAGSNRRAMLALRRPRSWRRALGLGLALIVGVFLFVGALSPYLQPGKEQGLTPSGWDASRAPQFAANFVVIAGLVPLVEEMLFRGVGFSLLARFGTGAAVVLVGAAFAAVHGLVEALPAFVLFGAGLAYLRVRTESLYPCVAVHATFNAIALVAAVAG